MVLPWACLPLALSCALSLPLVLLGLVKADPHPWNWLTIYVADMVFGLALLAQMAGFAARRPKNRLWTAAVGGYGLMAFGQFSLELALDALGLQSAPVENRAFLSAFMAWGFLASLGLLGLALHCPGHWQGGPDSQKDSQKDEREDSQGGPDGHEESHKQGHSGQPGLGSGQEAPEAKGAGEGQR
jgi:hypothetical protein